VIHDAQYTPEEYVIKFGWGHSTYEYATKVCQMANVKKLAFTHHDPARTDDALDERVAAMQHELKKAGSSLKVFGAAEGQIIKLEPPKAKGKKVKGKMRSSINLSEIKRTVLVYCSTPEIADIINESLETIKVEAKVLSTIEEAEKNIIEGVPTLLIIEHVPPTIDGLKICKEIRKKLLKISKALSTAIIADKRDIKEGEDTGVNFWLITPFTKSYVQSKLQAWLLRQALHWLRAPIPKNEKQRLQALHDLNILHTEPEEKFDRITRLAAALFHVPIALVSLVEQDRQWFKSCHGLDFCETSRETSFCAHTIYAEKLMIVEDTFLDKRFSDNPLVLEKPRIRFYAGCPLILPNNFCIGTLCLIDTRPRSIKEIDVKLLEDLRDLILREITQKYSIE